MADRDRSGLSVKSELRRQLLDLIGDVTTLPLDDEFERLAHEVFAFQFSHNSLYRAFCERRGMLPNTIRNWLDIPAVPTDAFKAAPLLCGDPNEAAVVFRTSGTTTGAERRGAHYLLDTDLYRSALRRGFQQHLVSDLARLKILSLIPSPAELPDSSLSFMIAEVMDAFGSSGSGYFVAGQGAWLEELLEAMESSREESSPVLLVGTSFAFVHLLDALAAAGKRVSLPAGSRAMDTGGYKGRSREVSRPDLYRLIADGLGVPSPFIVNEYGMTEMSSQLYDGTAGSAAEEIADRVHIGPGWVRTVAVDPETLRPVPAGQIGILRHLDLANLYSVAALQTSDLGRVTSGGIELLGRATGAEARGCSIAMEELMAAIDRTKGATG